MLDSVAANKSFEECKQILVENVSLDPGFKTFYDWCLQNDIPVIVLSSGMTPIIRVLLEELVGPSVDNIEIVANDVRDKPDGTWEIVFHDER
jgi:2-hydroxy-3-keto-5-methylthiopentenyl-1-phosphate phosphatase